MPIGEVEAHTSPLTVCVEDENLQRQIGYFRQSPLLSQLLDALPQTLVLILNQSCQIVYANRPFLDFAGLVERHDAFCLSPGELLGCQRATKANAESATQNSCRSCIQAEASLRAEGAPKCIAACCTAYGPETLPLALDLHVQTMPFMYRGEPFIFFTALDVSDEKYRDTLDRTFFHDILNTIGTLESTVKILPRVNPKARPRLEKMIIVATKQAASEVKAHQAIWAAARNRLCTRLKPVESLKLLHVLTELYSSYEIVKGCTLKIDPQAENVTLVTDVTLLNRVLGNLLKNALEASKAGETVTIGCEKLEDRVQFWINNEAYIPRTVQKQLFQWPIPSQEKNRGIGTYSAKLLTDRYLQGNITFASSHDKGTTFWVTCPLTLSSPE